MKRKPLQVVLVILLSMAACTRSEREPKLQPQIARPNIVLIMADDMGFSDLRCYGGEIDTPNLDRLAAHGLRFTQFYNTGRCCPTRASLMTGLWSHQTGMGGMTGDEGLPGYRGDLNENCVTIAEVLKQAGYKTFMSGKWHLTKHVGFWSGRPDLVSKRNWPIQRGFDQFYGAIFGVGNHFNPRTLTRDNNPIQITEEDYYFTDAISRETARFIREVGASGEGDPFFCYVAYSAPHWALQAPSEVIEKYNGRYAEGWDTARMQRLERMISMGIVNPDWSLSPRDSTVSPWPEAASQEWHQRRMEVHAAMVDRMDQGIGTILNAVEENGASENTLVFFLSDNGGSSEELEARHATVWFYPKATRIGRRVQVGNDPDVMPGPADTYQSYGVPWSNVSNTPFRKHKKWVHEGGIATPLIVHWPLGIGSAGELRHQVSHVVDIMATCLEVSGTEYPETFAGRPIIPLEGESLVPAFENQTLDREALFFEHMGNRAVRIGEWKLVAEKDGEWELYDLDADRTETRDLAGHFPERVQKMRQTYLNWARRANVLKTDDPN